MRIGLFILDVCRMFVTSDQDHNKIINYLHFVCINLLNHDVHNKGFDAKIYHKCILF